MPKQDAKAKLDSGVAMMGMGANEQALEVFEDVIEIDPNYALAHINRGGALYELGRYEEALAAFDHGISLDPNDFVAHYNRGSTLSKLKREHESLIAFERAIEICPDISQAHFNLGAALFRLGWLEEALRAFEKAIELDPNDNDARDAKLKVLRKLHRVSGTRIAMFCDARQFVQLEKLVQTGRIADAETLLGEIACRLPQPETIANQFEANQVMENCGALALTLKEHGQPQMAVLWFNRLCQYTRRFAPASVDTAWNIYHYVECLVECGHIDRAREICKEANNVNDTSGSPNEKLDQKIRHLILRCT